MISGVGKVFFQLGLAVRLVRISSYLIVVFNRRSFVHYTLALGMTIRCGQTKGDRQTKGDGAHCFVPFLFRNRRNRHDRG